MGELRPAACHLLSLRLDQARDRFGERNAELCPQTPLQAAVVLRGGKKECPDHSHRPCCTVAAGESPAAVGALEARRPGLPEPAKWRLQGVQSVGASTQACRESCRDWPGDLASVPSRSRLASARSRGSGPGRPAAARTRQRRNNPQYLHPRRSRHAPKGDRGSGACFVPKCSQVG